jgi:hypothetical protein
MKLKSAIKWRMLYAFTKKFEKILKNFSVTIDEYEKM